MLPHDFPPWKTVYHYFRLWRKDGNREQINIALRIKLRKADGREPEPIAAILDSQSVKTTSVKGIRGYDAGKKVNESLDDQMLGAANSGLRPIDGFFRHALRVPLEGLLSKPVRPVSAFGKPGLEKNPY
jgi:hypothetical protein